MNKLFLIILAASISASAHAQKYMTRTGKITFDATAPKSPEQIDAVNNEVAAILSAADGKLVFQVPVRSFKFQRDLMQQHFNENYMESDKYPKAEFKGGIEGKDAGIASTSGSHNVTVKGKLTIHGVTKEVSVPGKITVADKKVKLEATFAVKLEDYGISIPNLVADKVGKEAKITVNSELTGK